MYFIITTNREVADAIEKQLAFDSRMGNRSYKFGGSSHHEGYSDVKIEAKNERIEPSDIFWLGHLSSAYLDSKDFNPSIRNPEIIKDCIFSVDCFRKIETVTTPNSE